MRVACFLLLLVIVLKISFAQRTAVLILARGGSKGIRLKNLQIVGGVSLLARSILMAKQAGFADITVSTDHPLIALEAVKYKANIFKRSYVTATDWAPSIWGAAEFIKARADVHILILVQVTSPLTQAKSLRSALIKLKQPIPFDCLFSVTRSAKLRWNPKNITPINFVINKRPRRQDWIGELIETGSFYISRTGLIKKGYFQNNNCTVWEVSQAESFEIDSCYDVVLANILLKHIEL